jgi:heat shock protein HslJ
MTRLLVLTLAFAALVVGCANASGGLQNTTWKWSASTTTQPVSQSVVPDPDNYTIVFKPNDTFEGKADCNQVSGQWSTDTGNGLDITVGPSTQVACGPDSLAPQFVAGLDKATAYVLDSNGLTLTLGTEGTMTFRK